MERRKGNGEDRRNEVGQRVEREEKAERRKKEKETLIRG